MVQYRRNYIPGGTYFFTVTLQDRRSTLLTDRIDDLKHAIAVVKRERPFRIDAMVIMPDHLHAIWTLPDNDADYSGRWRAIKARFSHAIAKVRRNNEGTEKDDGYRLWQARFWEHTIRNEADLQRHVDYIHYNPVKHGYVQQVKEWRWSSFHRYVRLGQYPLNWGGGQGTDDSGVAYGELKQSSSRKLLPCSLDAAQRNPGLKADN